jgi:uncharacterized protein YjbI with pentapeptide repeats
MSIEGELLRERQQRLKLLREDPHGWNDWRKADPNTKPDLMEEDLSDLTLNGYDLHGANLYKANLSKTLLVGANLTGADLTSANLSRSVLTMADLSNADLSEATLAGAYLGRANITSADLSDANLRDSELIGVNLVRACLVRADISGAHCGGADFTDANLNLVRWDKRKMRGRYRGIRGIDSSFGNAIFKRAAADQDFLDTLEDHWRGTWRIYLFRIWGLLTDYGRSVPRVMLCALVIATMYGIAYSLYPDILSYASGKNITWFTPFYFSIVTYTTLGFGDVFPTTAFAEILVSSEVILGYLTLGLLLALLAEKVGRRS